MGAVVAMVLNDQATSADEQGILRGIERILATLMNEAPSGS